ncbi:MAG: hypothetical protein JO326_14180 [Acetobacteraceae bacterium]|nr:hypothetical protein [Acetobacteraceae bacterium]
MDGRSEQQTRVDVCKVEEISVGVHETGRLEPELRLLNRGKSPITQVYASPANAAAGPGDNLLSNGGTLPPEASRSFRLTPGICNYDLRVVFANKQSREKKNADLCHTGDLPVQ